MKQAIFKFDSLESLKAQSSTRAVVPSNDEHRKGNFNMTVTHKGWFGMPNDGGPEMLTQQLRDGWPEGRQRAEEKLSRVKAPKLRSVRRKRVRGPQGSDVDMQRVYTGELDRAWDRVKRQKVSAPPRVHLIVTTVLSADCSRDQLLWRGAAAFMIAEEMMKAGYNIKITAANITKWSYLRSTDGYSPVGGAVVTIKNYRQRPNPGVLFAACAHPGVVRSLIFSAMFSLCPFSLSGGLGSGRKMEIPKEVLKKISQPDEKLIIVPHLENERDANNWLTKIGEQLEG